MIAANAGLTAPLRGGNFDHPQPSLDDIHCPSGNPCRRHPCTGRSLQSTSLPPRPLRERVVGHRRPAQTPRYYNAVVRDFNTAVSTFPSNLFAGSMGYKELEFFQAEEADRALPKVSF